MVREILYPTNELEQKFIDDGDVVCGIDEVGRGAWAGPLVIGCVIPGVGTIQGVRDSKKVTPKNRQRLSLEINQWAKGIGIGVVTNKEIDLWGMKESLKQCALRAIEQVSKVSIAPDKILLDGHYDFIADKRYEVTTVIKGDNVSHAIAAASIVAKVFRDNYMASEEVARRYKQFFFEKNKGYPAPVHKEALKTCGPTELHRISWNILSPTTPVEHSHVLF